MIVIRLTTEEVHCGLVHNDLLLTVGNCRPTVDCCLCSHLTMFTFFKINSEQQLEWDHDPQDLCTFIVIVTAVEHQLGWSTYVLSNRKHQKEITKKYSTVGHSTIRVASQFDVALETSVSCLSAGMSVIGFNALKTFLEAKRDRPFAHAGLKQVLEAIEKPTSAPNMDQEEIESLGYASPLES